MNLGFQQTDLSIKLDLNSGVNFQLLEYLYFNSQEFGQLRTLTTSDGISVPRAIENIIERFGPYVASGIVHDGAFREKLEQLQPNGTWIPFMVTDTNDGRANRLIEEALKSEGCSWLERTIIYHTLQLFGWKAFDDDRDAINNKPTVADIAVLVKPVTT